jgi:hypothetical protein
MFTTALSSIAKLWNEPRCPLTGESRKKMWHIHAMEYYLVKLHHLKMNGARDL